MRVGESVRSDRWKSVDQTALEVAVSAGSLRSVELAPHLSAVSTSHADARTKMYKKEHFR